MCSRFAQTFALVATGVLLAGCTDPDSSPRDSGPASNGAIDEIAAHDGEVCPTRLPHGSGTAHGVGVDEPADSAPSLGTPESAWICRYSPIDSRSDSGGMTWAWVLDARAQRVAAARLHVIARDLTALAPVKDGRACTDDLGQRWMLVFTHGTELTGVVIDDFGCRDVRLTDDPFETAPGEANSAGTVPGVLAAPDEFLDDLKDLHHP